MWLYSPNFNQRKSQKVGAAVDLSSCGKGIQQQGKCRSECLSLCLAMEFGDYKSGLLGC